MSIADDLINDIKNTATTFKNSAVSYSERAVGQFSFGGGVNTVLQVEKINPELYKDNNIDRYAFDENNDLRWDFTLKLNELEFHKSAERNSITSNYNNFISTYFPSVNKDKDVNKQYGEMTNMLAQIANGSKSVPLQVEQQWNAARDRELLEARRLEDEAYTQAASRGFSIPPLTTQFRVLSAHQTASKNISATNREIAVENAKMQMEMVKFAIEKLFTARELMLDSVLKQMAYLREETDASLRVTQAYIQAYQVFYGALNGYYNSIAEYNKLKYSVDEGNLRYAMEDRKIAIGYKQSDEQRKTNAFISSANTATSIAAAALSGLNALVVEANSTS